jgi:hypothetical protein
MAIARCRILCCVWAEARVFGRRDRDLDRRSESSGKQIRCRFSVVSSICEEQINRTVDLINRSGSVVGSPASSLVRSEQTISPLIRSRPRCSLRQERRLRLVLCFSSSHSPSPNILRPVLSTTIWITAWLLARGLACNIKQLPRRYRVEKSGTAISTSSSLAMERIKPWVWRSGCLNTTPSVRQSSIARSE